MKSTENNKNKNNNNNTKIITEELWTERDASGMFNIFLSRDIQFVNTLNKLST